MKIGIAVYNFDPKKGGAERYAYDLSLNLARKGYTPYVFCTKGVEANWVKRVIIKTTPFPRWLRNLSFAISHRRKLKECPVDVMIGFGNTLTADIYQSHGGVTGMAAKGATQL
jgi:UDP-glucose:(heptosyl)LPS alpha-1,3-glucosyltransferase